MPTGTGRSHETACSCPFDLHVTLWISLASRRVFDYFLLVPVTHDSVSENEGMVAG